MAREGRPTQFRAIAVRELDPTAHLALKHDQLMSKRGILSLEPADRPERRNQQPQKEDEQRDHRGRRYVIPSSDQTDEVFGTHRIHYCRLIETNSQKIHLQIEGGPYIRKRHP